MPLDVTDDYHGDPTFSGLPLPSDGADVSTGRSADLGMSARANPPQGLKDWQKLLAISLAAASDTLSRKRGGGSATALAGDIIQSRSREQTAYQRYMLEYDKLQTDRMTAFANMRTTQLESASKSLKLAADIHKMAPDASDEERERIADSIHEQAVNAGVIINQGVFRIIARRPDVANRLGDLLPYANSGAGLGRGIIMLEAAIRDGKVEKGMDLLEGFARPFVTEDLFDVAPGLVKQMKAMTNQNPTFDEFLPMLRSAGNTGPAMANLARGAYGQSDEAYKQVRKYLSSIGVVMPETTTAADEAQRVAEARKQGEIAGDPEGHRLALAKAKVDLKKGVIDIAGMPAGVQARLNADPEARAAIDAGQKPSTAQVGRAIAAEEAALLARAREQGLMAADVKETTRLRKPLPANIGERMGGAKTTAEAEAQGYTIPEDRNAIKVLGEQQEFTRLALKQTDKILKILTQTPEAYGTSGELAAVAEGIMAQVENFARLSGISPSKITASKNVEHYKEAFSKVGVTTRVRQSQVLALAFLGAEAKGFEGRELTDRKIALEIEQIGAAGQSPYAAIRVLKEYRTGLQARLDARWTATFGKPADVSLEGTIEVIRKSDRQPGTLPLKQFDPEKYERKR